jgi:hypothetical protein
MGTRLIVLCCLCAALAAPVQGATTQMWVWVDSQGVKHFSDKPVPGAKLISIASMEPSEPPRPAAPPPRTPSTAPRTPPAKASVQYDLLEIFQPADGETFFGSDAVVNVRVRSEPDLASGDQMRLYLDGNLVEGDPTAREFSLSGLERGAHSIRAQIVDAQGKPKTLSEPRMIHIRHNTVGTPRAVGPILRPPPPRPTPRPSS